MYDILKEFIKPELIILVPVLYLIGMAVKKSTAADRFIPWILGAVGIICCAMYILSTSDISGWRDVLMATFTAITQGILLAGASVYVNQLTKQTVKK